MAPSQHIGGFARGLLAAATAALIWGALGAPARAAPESGDWVAEKCARYRTAWEQGLARMGTEGLSAAFLERHAAFLASGCTAKADVCARSDREIALANAMIIMAMNAGMASTFPPFYCRD